MSAATDAAADYAKRSLGLPDDKTTWTVAQRDAYLQAVAEFRRANADMFTPEELTAADNYENFANSPDPADSFSYIDATVDALGESINELPGTIGNAVDTAGKAVWNNVPGWLKWGGLAALGLYAATLALPRLSNPKKK
ncbi:MAG: hypothetical protein LBK99_01525 [Opitutaceae bacterium]|jgi:hypothetical protein|nr:hypothetical protein [Opitutaceae bacterium]